MAHATPTSLEMGVHEYINKLVIFQFKPPMVDLCLEVVQCGSSASEICADLDWEASLGGISGFASLFVILFDHYLASHMYIPSVMAP